MNVTSQSDVGPSWSWRLLWAALFALAHTQSFAYYSNQHQYLLHGAALSGYGNNLKADWLSNTKDPTPIFSGLIAVVHGNPFQYFLIFGLYLLLLMLYFDSLRRLVESITHIAWTSARRAAFAVSIIAFHAAIFRWLSIRWTGVDWPWYAQAGLAAQYLLGPGLQPSAFGILLVTSLAEFARSRSLSASVLAAAAAAIHSTYMLHAGLMAAGYMLVLWREGRGRMALAGGGLALVIVVPVLIHNAVTFAPRDPEQFRESQRILSAVRIPHHTDVNRWFDAVAGAQLAVMAVGLALGRRSRIFPVLLVVTIVCVALSIAQVATGSHTLALVFPWRFSTILMPLAVALLLARVTALVPRQSATWRIAGWTAGIGLGISGLCVMFLGLGYATNDAEKSLLEFVGRYRNRTDVFLIPTSYPARKKEFPASQSRTFAPPPRPGSTGIAVDLQRFRLSSGSPIYVDFKAMPYAEEDVIEWQRRMDNVARWYGDRNWDRPGLLAELLAEGLTHVVAPVDKPISAPFLREVYRDSAYVLYAIEGGK